MTENLKFGSTSMGYFIALYVRGKLLDPALVTAALKIEPDYQHQFGEKFPIKSGGFGTRKISIWRLGGKGEKHDINGAVRNFLELHAEKIVAFNIKYGSIFSIDGVDDAYIDILIFSPDTNKSIYFELGSNELYLISKFGIPVRFSIKSG